MVMITNTETDVQLFIKVLNSDPVIAVLAEPANLTKIMKHLQHSNRALPNTISRMREMITFGNFSRHIIGPLGYLVHIVGNTTQTILHDVRQAVPMAI
jgi:hypothetical protein